jgi:hypothetical protein
VGFEVATSDVKVTFDIKRVAAYVALLRAGQIVLASNLESLKMFYGRVHLHNQLGISELVEILKP